MRQFIHVIVPWREGMAVECIVFREVNVGFTGGSVGTVFKAKKVIDKNWYAIKRSDRQFKGNVNERRSFLFKEVRAL